MTNSNIFRTAAALLLVSSLVACGPQPRETPDAVEAEPTVLDPETVDPVVARVEGSMIRRSDVEREFAAQQAAIDDASIMTSTDFERIREELIDQRLLAIEARSRGLHRSEESRRRMAQAEERILSNVLVDEVLSSTATEEAIRRIYDEQVQLIALGDEVRARHLLVDTEAEADAAKLLLDEGADFATLAIRISLDPATRLDGGNLGYFTREGISEPFGAIAFGLAEGETSEPFRSAFGWHIMKVEDRRRQPPPTFEALRPRIEEYFKFDQLVALVSDLRASADVTLIDLPAPEAAPAAVEPGDETPGGEMANDPAGEPGPDN